MCFKLICCFMVLSVLNFRWHLAHFLFLFNSRWQVFFCWWNWRAFTVVNCFWHARQMNLEFSWTDVRWSLKPEYDLKCLSQYLQGLGLWDILCSFSLWALEYDFPQFSHTKNNFKTDGCFKLLLQNSYHFAKLSKVPA